MNHRSILHLVVPSACLLLSACSTDLSPTRSNVTGTWSYTTSMSGGGTTCEATETRLRVTQEEDTFTGIVTSGTLRCDDGSQLVESDLSGRDVRDGSIGGRALSFRIDLAQWNHSGQVAETSMGGSVRLTGTVEGSGDSVQVDVNGTWSAEKQ